MFITLHFFSGFNTFLNVLYSPLLDPNCKETAAVESVPYYAHHMMNERRQWGANMHLMGDRSLTLALLLSYVTLTTLQPF